jgi:uncharacterized protein
LSADRPPPSGARRAFLSALRIGIGVYVALLLMLLLLQSRLVFFPTRAIEATPADAGLAFEDVWLGTDDGLRLHGWWVPAEHAPGAVLFFHGNAGNISHRLGTLDLLHRLGYSTLIIDYRGYGRSEGRPSEHGTYRDAAAAWRHLLEERGIPAERIALFGRSLGGAVAADLAARHRPAALVLESTFTSVPDLGAELYPWLPVRMLSRIRYDTRSRLAAVDAPVLIVHSRDDEIIPFAHGRRLHEAVRGTGEFLEISGGHNAGFVETGARYEAGLARFLSRHIPPLGGSSGEPR